MSGAYNPNLPFRIWYAPCVGVEPEKRGAALRVDSHASIDDVNAAIHALPHGHDLLRVTLGPDDDLREQWPFPRDTDMSTVYASTQYDINSNNQVRTRRLATLESIRFHQLTPIPGSHAQVPTARLDGNGMV
jgi:hypothetical protein